MTVLGTNRWLPCGPNSLYFCCDSPGRGTERRKEFTNQEQSLQHYIVGRTVTILIIKQKNHCFNAAADFGRKMIDLGHFIANLRFIFNIQRSCMATPKEPLMPCSHKVDLPNTGSRIWLYLQENEALSSYRSSVTDGDVMEKGYLRPGRATFQ